MDTSKSNSFQMISRILNGFKPKIYQQNLEFTHHLIHLQELKKLSSINSALGFLNIAKEYIFIFGVIYICVNLFHPAFYFFTVLWVGARQHALGIIGHDVVHYRLLKNKSLNDFFGNIFCLLPLSITVEGYRRQHLLHHRYVDTEYDIDWLRTKNFPVYIFPQSKFRFIWHVFKHLAGWYSSREFYIMLIKCKFVLNLSFKTYLTMMAFYSLAIFGIYYFDLLIPYLMYWVVPLSTVLVACSYYRIVAEHSHVPKGSFYNTRNVYTSLLESLFIAPNGVNYHLDHHLFPSVPFYHLPKLHQKLLESKEYIKRASNVNGYSSGLLDEISNTSNAKTLQIENNKDWVLF